MSEQSSLSASQCSTDEIRSSKVITESGKMDALSEEQPEQGVVAIAELEVHRVKTGGIDDHKVAWRRRRVRTSFARWMAKLDYEAHVLQCD